MSAIEEMIPITNAPAKIPLPKLKGSAFGDKIADVIPKEGVPRNWTREQIGDAIIDYQTSIATRKAEQTAFASIGSDTQRLAHAQRITEEAAFLKSLMTAFKNRK